MSDQPLWDLVNGKPRKKLGLDLSNRHSHRGDAGKFAVKPTDTPGQPEPLNAAIKHPLDGSVLMLKRSGRFFTTALIAMSFGIKLSKRQESEPGSSYVPLTNKQATKILEAVESQCMGLDDQPDPNTKASALTKAEREGRVSSTGPRAGFGGIKMRSLRSGGLVQASNADHGATILTPTNYEPWESIEQGRQPALSQLSQDILNSIPRTN